MSVPGQQKKNYSHKVQFGCGNKKYFKLIGIVFVLFTVIMLICIRCQVKKNNRKIEALENEIIRLTQTINDNKYGGVRVPVDGQRDNDQAKIRQERIFDLLIALSDKLTKLQKKNFEQSMELQRMVKEVRNSLGKSQKFSETFSRQFTEMKQYLFKLMQPMKSFLKKWF